MSLPLVYERVQGVRMQQREPGVEVLDRDFVPQLSPDVVFIEVENEAVLYDERTGGLHQLNPIAAIVCQCYDGDASVAVIADELSAAFGVDRRKIEKDVLSMTRHLAGVGVLIGIEGLEPEPANTDDDRPAQAEFDDC